MREDVCAPGADCLNEQCSASGCIAAWAACAADSDCCSAQCAQDGCHCLGCFTFVNDDSALITYDAPKVVCAEELQVTLDFLACLRPECPGCLECGGDGSGCLDCMADCGAEYDACVGG